MTISHQAIREVVEAFNAGELQIETITRMAYDGEERYPATKVTSVTIEIRAQPEHEGRIVETIVQPNGSTFRSTL